VDFPSSSDEDRLSVVERELVSLKAQPVAQVNARQPNIVAAADCFIIPQSSRLTKNGLMLPLLHY